MRTSAGAARKTDRCERGSVPVSMTKLIIQIPCFNEEATLGVTLNELPRAIPGIDVVEWLVIDDGSSDRTAEVARARGVDHVIRLPKNRGLATAFTAGLYACIERGADIIVNTDADNQYCASDIPFLVAPILEGRAELVIGARPIATTPHFSPAKKLLQALGSRVVRIASKTDVPDAPSGFRAMSRTAAMQLHVFSEYTYTLETIIQAGQKGLAITSVPVRVNGDLRPSRLVKTIPSYIRRSIVTIGRIFITYRPMRFFAAIGTAISLLGFLLGIRYLYFRAIGYGVGHVQSVILSALLLGAGGVFVLVGILADLIAVNRKLLEGISFRLYSIESKLRESKGP